jgi:hypothetical protein
MLWMLVIGALLAVSLRWRMAPIAALALFLAGVELRIAHLGSSLSSDVLSVTRAATETMLAGGNPYGIGYDVSLPPGAPYPYGPLGLLWYLPTLAEPRVMELLAAVVVLGLLAIRGRLLGLAIYACAPVALSVTIDGSNDTSAGLLILVALVTIDRLPHASALMLGVAIAFKPYALAWAPPLVAYLGLSALLPLVVGAGVFWIPAIVMWGIGNVVESVRLADRVHDTPYYSLGMAVQRLGIAYGREELNLLRFLVGGVTALAVMFMARTSGAVIVGGILIFVATLFTGYWGAYTYFAAIAPLICWHLDDWLGRSESRARWPFEPWSAAGRRRFGARPTASPPAT